MMNPNEECPMDIDTPPDDEYERKHISKLLSKWISEKILNRKPIPERLVIKDVLCTLRGAFQLITFYNSENYNHGALVSALASDDPMFNSRLFSLSHIVQTILSSKCRFDLKELSLSEFCNSSIVKYVSYHCENLTKLELVYDEKSQDDNNSQYYIQAFADLKKLVSIKIHIFTDECDGHTNFPLESIDHLPEGMNEIHLFFKSKKTLRLFFKLERFKDLRKLTLQNCNLSKMIQDISKKSTLVYLDIRNCRINDGCFWPMEFNELVHLTHLHLPPWAFNYDMSPNHQPPELLISSDVLFNIFNTCKHLEHIDIYNGSRNDRLFRSNKGKELGEPHISPDAWVNLRNLVYFGVGWKISDDFATNMIKYCSKLKYFNSHYTDNDIISKLTQLENLEGLILHDMDSLSIETIIAISNCKKLKYLEIVGCTLLKTDDQLSRKTLSYSYVFDTLSKLQHLEYVHLSIHIGKNFLLQTQQHRCEADDAIIFIVNKCRNLKHLNIGGRSNLTKTTFDALTSLENLEKLTIDDSESVTNDFVGKLKGLKFFSCMNCLNLFEAPENGINQLIENCPNLEELVLSSIDNNFNALKTIIAAADSATRNRVNNTILYIRISGKLSEDFKVEIESRWLVVDSLSLNKTSENPWDPWESSLRKSAEKYEKSVAIPKYSNSCLK